MKKVIHHILVIVTLVVMVISIWKIIEIQKEYRAGEDSYSSLEQYVSVPSVLSETEKSVDRSSATEGEVDTTESVMETEEVEIDDTVWPSVDFDKLSEINPNIVGWIYIEGTNINYPVVQGEDNEYYLDHLFEGRYNSSGCIFLDANCSSEFADQHSIIYGHNMKNNSMFAGLTKYQQQEYYDEHPMALLITPEHKYKILFFSGYIAGTSANSWQLDFSEEDYGDWQDVISDRSLFDSDITPDENDSIITLSTCTYEFDNVRFVLHGILR